jgi:hypothetical protein
MKTPNPLEMNSFQMLAETLPIPYSHRGGAFTTTKGNDSRNDYEILIAETGGSL